MSKSRLPTVALCYDFDGTLAPGNMQERDYIPQLGLKPSDFWREAKALAQRQEADEILAYMSVMLEKAGRELSITKKSFSDYGAKLTLFNGVEQWFDAINAYGKEIGVRVQHFIISSGIREMIEGTAIAKHFERIYASSFMYDQHDVAYWPAQAVNFTTKTQFLFRINKGVLDPWVNDGINTFQAKEDRPVPFERIIYIGDGSTDIPCMRLVKEQGGISIAVYTPHNAKSKASVAQLFTDGRVHFTAPADYSPGKQLDTIVRATLDEMAADHRLQQLQPKASKAKDGGA